MENTYIGQTQNVMNRLYKHIEDSTKPNASRFHKFLAENKDSIYFSVNIATPKFDGSKIIPLLVLIYLQS